MIQPLTPLTPDESHQLAHLFDQMGEGGRQLLSHWLSLQISDLFSQMASDLVGHPMEAEVHSDRWAVFGATGSGKTVLTTELTNALARMFPLELERIAKDLQA